MRIMYCCLVVFVAVMISVVVWSAEAVEVTQPQQVKRIYLTVEEAGGVDRLAWPVTQGIPFAEGDFPIGTAARVVLEDGTPIPTQSQPLTTWSKDKKFIKWLLVDFQIDLKANQKRRISLEYGPGVELVKGEKTVTIRRDKDTRGEILRIDTGAMQLDLQFERSDFFDAFRVRAEDGWRELIKSGSYLYMTDAKGECYRSDYSLDAPKIEVEDAGPIRASVCIRGRYASSGNKLFCPYILRIHAYAGSSDLRIYHTFVFTGDPKNDELTELGMNFPVSTGADVKMAFGGSSGAHELGKAKTGLFLQSSDLQYTVSRDGKDFCNGDKTTGWASLSGRDGSVIVALRDLWQEYPKGIKLKTDGIDVQFWPKACSERIVFRNPFYEESIFFKGTRDEEEVKRLLAARPTAPLNLKSFDIQSEEALVWVEQMVAKYAPNRAASHNDTGGGSDGYGAAKTHELVLRLSPKAVSSDECESLGRCVQESVIAPADPAYTCATVAVRHAYHSGDPIFKDIDAGLDALVDTIIIEPRMLCRRYGMWMWGSLMCSHSTGPAYSYRYHKNNGTPMIASKYIGPYNNESNDQVWNVWFNFVRTGSRKRFLLAESVSEQMADVTIHHEGGWQKGLMHYHSAHYWGGGASPSHTLTGGLMLHYYFTGNRRMLDVAKEMADWAVWRQEPCGIISNRVGVLHREFTGPLLCLFDVYQATWDEKYGRLAERSLNWLLKTQREPGVFPVTVFTRGKMGDEAWVDPGDKPGAHDGAVYPIYYDGYHLFKSDLLRKTIIAEANQYVFEEPVHQYYTLEMAKKMLSRQSELYSVNDKWFWSNWPGPPMESTVCLAYDITGDPIYAAWADYMLHEYFVDRAERARNLAPLLFTYVYFAQPISAMMRIVHDATEKDPEAFKRAQAEWRRRREANGLEVYTGPHDWLPRTQKYFDANGNVIGAKPVKLEGLRENVYIHRGTPASIGRISPD